MELAVKAGDDAMPELFVVTMLDPPNTPLAPVPGAERTTVTPDTGSPAASTTLTTSGLLNVLLIGAL